jgi:hypothetical protein
MAVTTAAAELREWEEPLRRERAGALLWVLDQRLVGRPAEVDPTKLAP